jgi:hypothetical protein
MGIQRSTVLIDAQGKVAKVWNRVKVAAHEKRKRWSRRVVQRHALHRDKLGGGVSLEKVRKSN